MFNKQLKNYEFDEICDALTQGWGEFPRVYFIYWMHHFDETQVWLQELCDYVYDRWGDDMKLPRNKTL